MEREVSREPRVESIQASLRDAGESGLHFCGSIRASQYKWFTLALTPEERGNCPPSQVESNGLTLHGDLCVR